MRTDFTVDELRQQFTQLYNSRSSMDYFWNLVLRLVNPAYNLQLDGNIINGSRDFFSSFSGETFSRLNNLYHNRGSVNSSLMASYLHSNLTNPHSDWMRITAPESYHLQNRSLSDDTLKTLQALQLISQECHNSWQSSNFHSTMFGFYKSLVDIGTSCLFRGYYKVKNGLEPYYRNISMFNVYFMEDVYGRPAHVFVVYQWTGYQIVSYFFPNKSEVELRQLLPGDLVDCAYKRDTTLFTCIHSVYSPNMDDNSVHSCYFLYNSNDNSSSSNQRDFDAGFLRKERLGYIPYSISRIRKNAGSQTGTGFSMEAFPLLAKLQRTQRAIWIANDKNIKPPLNAPTERLKFNYSSDPGVINPMDLISGKPVGIAPVMPELNILNIEQTKQSLLQDIDQTYMIDKILMENVRYNRTAQEVQKRTGEEIRLLSPFIGSLENEFLRPLVDFSLKLFTKRPAESMVVQALEYLNQSQYRLQYISPIAQVQVQKQIQNYLEFYGYSNALSQKEKRIDFKMDWMAFWLKMAILQNAPFDTIKTMLEYQKSQNDYEKQMEDMKKENMLMNIDKFGGTMKSLAEADNLRRTG